MGQLESLRKLTLHSLFKSKKKEKKKKIFAYALIVLSDEDPSDF
jgi:hypothetical protein